MNNSCLSKPDVNPNLSGFLDLARWLAALLVVLDHFNNRFFLHLRSMAPGQRSFPVRVWGFVCGFGHPAVLVFFVLSGFLVGGPLVRQINARCRVDYGKYLFDRWVRIYLVLLPALALGAVLDTIGRIYLADAPIYAHVDWATSLSIKTLIGVSLNLQGFFVPAFGTNGPLGTLANEVWYYLNFPLLLMPLDRTRSFAVRWGGFLLGAGLLTVLGMRYPWHVSGLLVWCLGVAVAVAPQLPRRMSPTLMAGSFVAITVLMRLLVRAEELHGILLFCQEMIIGTAFALAVCAYRGSLRARSSFLGSPVHKQLAGMSFSVYVTHAVVLTLIAAFCEKHLGFSPQRLPTERWWLTLAILLMPLGVGWLFAAGTERHTYAVKSFLRVQSSRIGGLVVAGLALNRIPAKGAKAVEPR